LSISAGNRPFSVTVKVLRTSWVFPHRNESGGVRSGVLVANDHARQSNKRRSRASKPFLHSQHGPSPNFLKPATHSLSASRDIN
jgi:hypothetical protein